MALAPTPFVWGRGGRRMTPEEIAREREIADKLGMQAGDTSPVGHWTQGAARVVNALGGVMADRRANAATELNAAEDKTALTGLLGLFGGGSTVSPTTANVASALVPSGGGIPAQTAMVEGQPPVPGLQPAVTDIAAGIRQSAEALGIDPVDLATVISYETGGTFDPMQKGPTTKWGQHKGLIQFGEPQAQEYGVDWNSPLASQLGPEGAVVKYLRSNGVTPGMGLLDVYSTINAGAPGLYDRSDAAAGGAPGTVRDKVENQMGGHRAKALALFGGNQSGAADAVNAMGAQTGYVDPYVSAQPAQPAAPAPAASGGIMDAIAPPMSEGYFPPAPSAPQTGAIDPAVIEALSSQYASPQTKQVASMLLERTMSQQQQAQERALQEQQRAAEIQQRQAFLQANGLDPSIAMVDEAWAEAAKAPFRPRNTAVVNGVLVDAETGAPIYQGQPEKPTSVQEFEYGQQNPAYFDTQERLKRAGAQNIDLGGNKFDEQFGSLDAKTLTDVGNAGMSAMRNLGRIDQLEGLLAEAPSGFSALLAQRAGEFGIKTDGLDTLQAAQALINSLVPEQRPPGSGPMSDADLELFKQSLPRLINQPEGNRRIIETMRGVAQYDAEGARILQDLRAGNIDRATAFQQLQSRANPLAEFKAPPSAPPPASEDPLPPQKITSKDQFDRLPSGTRFVDPQGNVRIKP